MVGKVAELWRYPVKSMQGEPVEASAVTSTGLVGDRAFALLDVETGRIASAKSPRTWPNLLDFRAALAEEPQAGHPLPPVRITLPDGSATTTDAADVEQVLSGATGRRVRLISSNPRGATYEQFVPDIEGADPRGQDLYTQFPNDVFQTGSLHDAAPVHLVTTSTLATLGSHHPEGDFDVRRFRPNVVIDCDDELAGFVENDWVKSVVDLGEVRVRVTVAMLRCVMTTLAQPGLSRDLGILRTVTAHNRQQVLDLGRFPCVGVIGLVDQSGPLVRGDRVTVQAGG